MKKTLMNFIACTNFKPPISKKAQQNTFYVGVVPEGYFAVNMNTNEYLLADGGKMKINGYPNKEWIGWHQNKNKLLSLIEELNYQVQQ